MATTPAFRDQSLTMKPIFLVAVLLISIASIVGYAQYSGTPSAVRPPDAPIVTERVFQIDGQISGAAVLRNGEGEIVATFAAGEAVFITTVERVIEFQRSKQGVSEEGPIVLRERATGQLSVYDPSTDSEIQLKGFGVDNIAAFAALLRI